MSLGPTYVLADNGLLYKDPSIRGEDWFICFDEDDPPELVIATNGRPREELELRVKQILSDSGIVATTRGIEGSGSRKFDGRFRPAIRCWLSIKTPAPAQLFSPGKGYTYREARKKSFSCTYELCGGKMDGDE